MTRLDLLRSPLAASHESIRFRFKTSYENGVILYSRGTQGDLIALELKNNKMVLNIDLGSGLMTSLSVGSLLDNNFWHDVLISRNKRDIIFSVDRVIVNARIKGEFNRLNLDRGVSVFIICMAEFQQIDFIIHISCRFTSAVCQTYKKVFLCNRITQVVLKIYISTRAISYVT